LIIARNELAHYLAKERSIDDGIVKPAQIETDGTGVENRDSAIESFLPPTIDHPRECKTCYAVDACMLYRKVSFDDPSHAHSSHTDH
jgi:DNA replication ATP-dependent helicase Dna2